MTNVNDRLRTVAYEYFEHHADRSMIPSLLAALEREDAEFVRPALVRALAAVGSDPRASSALIREIGRGEDFFRSAVIEALGDYKAEYAIPALLAVAKLDGPLVDDAVLAMGKIGDAHVREPLNELRRTGPGALQPTIAAAACLLGESCDERERYLIGILSSKPESGTSQETVRAAAAGLTTLAVAGRASAASALFDIGVHAHDPIRSPIALGVATAALRNTALIFSVLAGNSSAEVMALLADGFDMLEEDFEKERFFALARKTYWSAPEGSPTRALMQKLIGELEF